MSINGLRGEKCAGETFSIYRKMWHFVCNCAGEQKGRDGRDGVRASRTTFLEEL